MKKNLFFALILSLTLFACEDYDNSHGKAPDGTYKDGTTTSNTNLYPGYTQAQIDSILNALNNGAGTTTGDSTAGGTTTGGTTGGTGTNTGGNTGGTTTSTLWMPLAIGNTWTMTSTTGEQSITTITGTETANSYTYFITSSDADGYTRFRYDAEGNLYSQIIDADKTENSEDKIIPANPAISQTWKSGDGQSQFKVESLSATFGKYTELLSIGLYYSGIKMGTSYYKKGVGLVGYSMSFMGTSEELSLTTYTLK